MVPAVSRSSFRVRQEPSLHAREALVKAGTTLSANEISSETFRLFKHS
jgi:hypothetical protein